MARYHSLRIWKLGLDITREAYLDVKSLRGEADLRDQIKRSSRSVVANICEGSERGTDKEYKQFLVISRASAAELLSWYEILYTTGHIDQRRLAYMQEQLDHMIRSLSRFITRLADSS